ncbi:MAG: sigma-70 family RNA polymerase sigma factor [Nocardioidaceae bacterium]|nr:MAG: sigma-70 family RNA polymerase sigma factor [Nocardioidaceae bacterium]
MTDFPPIDPVDPDNSVDVAQIGTDPDVFEVFYRDNLETVQRFVARRVADPHLAADLTADVFLAAIDAASGYRADRGSPAGWLVGIARNTVAAEVRRQVRHHNAVRRISGRRLLDPDSLTHLVDRIDAERESRALYAALAALPKRDRALMELVALDGLPITEAAAVLGVKPATARVRLHRSRRLVQSHLQPHLDRVHPDAVAALTQEVSP